MNPIFSKLSSLKLDFFTSETLNWTHVQDLLFFFFLTYNISSSTLNAHWGHLSREEHWLCVTLSSGSSALKTNMISLRRLRNKLLKEQVM